MTEPLSTFMDPIAALEEAQWLANHHLQRYGLFWGTRGLTVRPVSAEHSSPLEIVYPTTQIDAASRCWVDKN